MGAQAPAEAPAEAPPPGPAPIAAPDIAARAEQALREATDLEARLTAAPPPRALQEEVDELDARVRLLVRVQRPGTVPLLAPRDIEDRQREWLRIEEELAERADLVARRLQAIDAGLARLDELATLWRVTADAAREAGLPDPVLRTIGDVQKRVDAAERRLIADRDALLALGSRIGPLQQQAADRIALVRNLAARARGEVLAIQGPPLWTALAALPDEPPAGAFATYGRDVRLLWTHLDLGRLAVRLLLFVVALALALDVRRQLAAWPPDDAEALARAERVAARPIASALLVALVVGTLLFPSDPVLLSELAIFASLVPLWLLVRGRLPGRLQTLVPAVAAIFVLAMVRRQLPPLSAWARLFLAVEALVGLAWVGWAFGLGRRRPAVGHGPWARRAAGAAAALLAVAFLANLVGAVALGVLVVQSVVASVFLALGLWATTEALEGLIVARLRPWRRYPIRAVAAHLDRIRLWAVRLVRLAGVVVWVVGTLALFGVQRDAADLLRRVLDASLTVGSLHLSVAGVLAFGVSVWLAVVAAGAVRALLEEDVLARMSLPRGVPGAVSAAANYTVLFVGILFAMSAAGLSLERVTLLAGAIGVGVGFGLQNVVNNFVSGLILLVERPMRIGDVVEVGPTVGTVRRIGIRSSTLRTFDGAEVIVPNGTLIAERLTNWTFSDYQRRVEVRVAVADGTDPEVVRTLLEEAARTEAAHDPPPEALVVGVGGGKLQFALRAWSPTYERAPEVQSRLAVAAHAALRAAGVELR